jgi:C4-dicarboxylate-specific signal transduction histidine kinase
MLTNLHVAYAELTRAQLEVERRMAEINETRELFERVIESMSEALFLGVWRDSAGDGGQASGAEILVNLINNAKYAMLAWEGRAHQLTLRVGMAEDRQGFVRLQGQDTGVGIKPEHLARIFAQGFTTKSDGHSLGLHSGALSARVLGGSLGVHSDGEGRGATFTLDLPFNPMEEGG